MASALNRTTKVYFRSADTPDFPVADWLINSAQADALFDAGVPPRHWNIVGDVVTEMTAPQKAAVDAALLQARRAATVAELDMVEGIVRAFMLVVIDEFNLHSTRLNAILDAVDAATSLADFKTRVALIPDIPQRTNGQLRTAIGNKLGT